MSNLLNLKQEPSTYTFPKLLLYLQIHEDHDLGDILLTSIIHPTSDAEPVYNMFVHTFLESPDEAAIEKKPHIDGLCHWCASYRGCDRGWLTG